MNLKIIPNSFRPDPHIQATCSDVSVLNSDMKYFDKDGYEINKTEELFYLAQGVNLSERHLYHTANHVSWFVDTDQSQTGPVLDHSMIVTRWSYTGAAREQIIRLSKLYPSLNKLLAVKPKWGIDFSLDYVYTGGCVELFHIEADYFDYNQAVDHKAIAEELIQNTDWQHGAEKVMQHKSEWIDLCSDDQADWKARYFGWHRAFDNLKVFA